MVHLPVMIVVKTACICPAAVDEHKQVSYYIENPVDIPNIRAPVFEAMVRFINTRELEPGLTSAAVPTKICWWWTNCRHHHHQDGVHGGRYAWCSDCCRAAAGARAFSRTSACYACNIWLVAHISVMITGKGLIRRIGLYVQ
jgi:hypothetical protein